ASELISTRHITKVNSTLSPSFGGFYKRGCQEKKPRQVAHSSKYPGLCPVHRGLIAMSGSSFVPWASACGRGLSGQVVVLRVLLTGFNRFGLFGVTFLVSWICISV